MKKYITSYELNGCKMSQDDLILFLQLCGFDVPPVGNSEQEQFDFYKNVTITLEGLDENDLTFIRVMNDFPHFTEFDKKMWKQVVNCWKHITNPQDN